MQTYHFAVLVSLLSVTNGYNSYIVVCPSNIRPGMTYCVDFSNLDELSGFQLYGRIFTSKTTIAEDSVLVPEGHTSAQLKLKLPVKLAWGSYQFEVYGKKDNTTEVFRNSTNLSYSAKGFSVFIQTDKAIYKPGQKVQFRVFSTLPDLATIKENMDIAIFDPNRNKIAQWLNVTGQKQGVFQGSLQLSDNPPLGDWKIDVDIGARSEIKMFTVDEYVLPKFEVSITLSSYGVLNATHLSGSVQATYTFGKGVQGNGSLTIARKRPSSDKLIVKKFTIDGVYKFEVELKEMRRIFKNITSGHAFELIAEVEEGITGIKRNDTAEITYYNFREKFRFLEGEDNFKPGLVYTSYLYVSEHDDKPPSNDKLWINVTAIMHYESMVAEPDAKPDDTSEQKRELVRGDLDVPPPPSTTTASPKQVVIPRLVQVPTNGIVVVTFNVPEYISRIELKAKLHTEEAYKSVEKFRSTSGNYIQISLRTRKPEKGKRVLFKIESTEGNMWINYVVLARGLLVKAGDTYVNKKGGYIWLTLTAEMAPMAKMVVYYVRKDAEVIADSTQFTVEGIFQNEVQIIFESTDPISKAEPATKVKVKVTATPGSICNVLTIDKSVLLLKSGNDITSDQVKDEIESYDPAPSPCTGGQVCIERYFSSSSRAVDVTGVFRSLGLSVLTDAYMYQYQPSFRRGPWAIDDRAMPIAFAVPEVNASPAQSQARASQPRVRKLFPETWIYESATADSVGTALIETTVPDTITTWVATAFAVNEESGLGVAPSPANLEVFLQFFVRLEMPYSVVRGEQVILQADVFNYFTETVEVEVTLKKSSAFQNIVVEKGANGKAVLSYDNKDIVRNIKVAPGGASAVKFPIKAVELGLVDVEVKAVTATAGDAIKKQLLVRPEGIPKSYAIPLLIDLRNTSAITQELAVYLPDDVVEGSDRISVSVIGDLMGPSISGLTNLLQMPYGCGEQNMITLVPNIVVVIYLDAIKQLKSAELEKAKDNMMNGYQRQMTYQRFDWSFSAFGKSDPSGSTWLTAFVIKSFAQASPYIFIDPFTVRKAIDFTLDQYDEKIGFFKEPGRVIHSEMLGGSASGPMNLASFVLIALLTAKDKGFYGNDKPKMESVIDDGVKALEKAVNDMDNSFELAIAGYALVLAKSSKVSTVKQKLMTLATEESGMLYWRASVEAPSSGSGPPRRAQARDIETTSYVLLIYATHQDVVVSLKIVKWLVEQRSPSGGFGSTQDTVIALQGLSVAAALVYSDTIDIRVTIGTRPVKTGQVFNINAQNAQVLQMMDAPPKTKFVDVNAEGKGICLVSVSVNYNIMTEPMVPKFNLSHIISDENINGFKLKVCFRYLGSGTSGMSNLEMGLLSGFEAGPFQISDLNILKKVEGAPSMQIYYFDEIPSDKDTCFTVTMQRVGLVVGSQPAVVKLYDYYEPDNQVTSMYQPELLNKANVCDLPENGIAEC